ncbi:MAG TPA: adenylate/guanylate cyclase domain-containing protein [Candidatus Tectomicrobia bacterium]|nr:adenylate/guanylate cyclase domain-containing protein [Candidatus Tectomicrobia bacterium]
METTAHADLPALVPAPQVAPEVLEAVAVGGDLSGLTAAQRLAYYKAVCASLGLNPLTKPFEYLTLNGKLRLYALRDCADQLRRLHGISITITSRERLSDLYVVTARAKDRQGREDESIGAVTLGTLKGDALANALMKCETKAMPRDWQMRPRHGGSAMTFEELLDQAMAMLACRGRVTYRALTLQFQLDAEQLEALKDELLYAYPQLVEDDGRGLVDTGAPRQSPTPGSPLATDQERAPLAYTPPHLAEKILTSKTALEGERKQVTVQFADLKGSLELLADRDPEEARQLLDRMMEAVHRYEGTVNQVMGDGIMAWFGAPLAHEDHALRACYAAHGMQDTLRRYSKEVRHTHGLEVQIRVGLNSGGGSPGHRQPSLHG